MCVAILPFGTFVFIDLRNVASMGGDWPERPNFLSALDRLFPVYDKTYLDRDNPKEVTVGLELVDFSGWGSRPRGTHAAAASGGPYCCLPTRPN